ncbi:MAG: motility associated factor glycosyltransferase family protein, partial [Treponema sp.]|nr:motility associated factor glycosyltransferase family protein [Treponema sp.]
MNTQNQKGVGTNKALLPLESSREEEILIEASSSGNGSPDTIRYKGRYLYSKYNPSRSVLSLIQGTKFLPGTIVIICSPCLWYGTEELLNALDAACKESGEEAKAEVCAIEADRNLYSLAKKNLESKEESKRIHFYFSDQLDEFESFLNEKISTGNFRRVLRLDFSAGTQFNAEWFTSICNAAEQMVASYWKNRITIVKMGRLFSRNIFKNLSLVGKTESASDTFLQSAAGMVSKPIIVFGAGESLDRTFAEENSPLVKEIENGRYFIIAVDAASQALLARGIRPDAIVAVESQFAIQESYASFTKKDFEQIILFADLCSRPQVARLFKKRIWFASEYAKCQYLDSIKERGIIQNLIPPLGSVGLTAVYIALVIRQSIATSVFVSGMDFSYSAGKTHAKNVSASKRLLFSCTRKNAAANYSASLLPPAFPVQSKDKSPMYSSPIMESYAINFAAIFSG